MATQSEAARHTCLKLEIKTAASEPIFVKGTWFDSYFHLSITDGLNAWCCNATEDEVRERELHSGINLWLNISNWLRNIWDFNSLVLFISSPMPEMARNDCHGKLSHEEEEESTYKTESYDEASSDEKSGEEPPAKITGTSKGLPSSRGRGRKKIAKK